MNEVNEEELEIIWRYYYETDNKIGVEAIKILVESLKTNSVLTNLDLRGKTEYQWVTCTDFKTKVNRKQNWNRRGNDSGQFNENSNAIKSIVPKQW